MFAQKVNTVDVLIWIRKVQVHKILDLTQFRDWNKLVLKKATPCLILSWLEHDDKISTGYAEHAS